MSRVPLVTFNNNNNNNGQAPAWKHSPIKTQPTNLRKASVQPESTERNLKESRPRSGNSEHYAMSMEEMNQLSKSATFMFDDDEDHEEKEDQRGFEATNSYLSMHETYAKNATTGTDVKEEREENSEANGLLMLLQQQFLSMKAAEDDAACWNDGLSHHPSIAVPINKLKKAKTSGQLTSAKNRDTERNTRLTDSGELHVELGTTTRDDAEGGDGDDLMKLMFASPDTSIVVEDSTSRRGVPLSPLVEHQFEDSSDAEEQHEEIQHYNSSPPIQRRRQQLQQQEVKSVAHEVQKQPETGDAYHWRVNADADSPASVECYSGAIQVGGKDDGSSDDFTSKQLKGKVAFVDVSKESALAAEAGENILMEITAMKQRIQREVAQRQTVAAPPLQPSLQADKFNSSEPNSTCSSINQHSDRAELFSLHFRAESSVSAPAGEMHQTRLTKATTAGGAVSGGGGGVTNAMGEESRARPGFQVTEKGRSMAPAPWSTHSTGTSISHIESHDSYLSPGSWSQPSHANTMNWSVDALDLSTTKGATHHQLLQHAASSAFNFKWQQYKDADGMTVASSTPRNSASLPHLLPADTSASSTSTTGVGGDARITPSAHMEVPVRPSVRFMNDTGQPGMAYSSSSNALNSSHEHSIDEQSWLQHGAKDTQPQRVSNSAQERVAVATSAATTAAAAAATYQEHRGTVLEQEEAAAQAKLRGHSDLHLHLSTLQRFEQDEVRLRDLLLHQQYRQQHRYSSSTAENQLGSSHGSGEGGRGFSGDAHESAAGHFLRSAEKYAYVSISDIFTDILDKV